MSWTYSVPKNVRDALVVRHSWTEIKDVINGIEYPKWLNLKRRYHIMKSLRFVALEFFLSQNDTGETTIRSIKFRFEKGDAICTVSMQKLYCFPSSIVNN